MCSGLKECSVCFVWYSVLSLDIYCYNKWFSLKNCNFISKCVSSDKFILEFISREVRGLRSFQYNFSRNIEKIWTSNIYIHIIRRTRKSATTSIDHYAPSRFPFEKDHSSFDETSTYVVYKYSSIIPRVAKLFPKLSSAPAEQFQAGSLNSTSFNRESICIQSLLIPVFARARNSQISHQ